MSTKNSNPNKPPADTEELIVASLGKRLLAMVYDLILVFALVFCAAMLFFALAKEISPTNNIPINEVQTDQVVHEIAPIELGNAIWLFWAYCLSVGIGFYIFFWKRNQQTLGMRAWKLKLENRENKTISFKQLLIRCFVSIVSFLSCGAGYLYMFFNPERNTLHDKISKTWVSMPAKK